MTPRTWRYRWQHLPSGGEGVREIVSGAYYEVLGKRIRQDADVAALLTAWNEDQPGVWRFTLA